MPSSARRARMPARAAVPALYLVVGASREALHLEQHSLGPGAGTRVAAVPLDDGPQLSTHRRQMPDPVSTESRWSGSMPGATARASPRSRTGSHGAGVEKRQRRARPSSRPPAHHRLRSRRGRCPKGRSSTTTVRDGREAGGTSTIKPTSASLSRCQLVEPDRTPRLSANMVAVAGPSRSSQIQDLHPHRMRQTPQTARIQHRRLGHLRFITFPRHHARRDHQGP